MSIDPKLVDVAAKVLRAAMEQGNREPYSLAFVLESAQLLQSPETAAELTALRARVTELETQPSRVRTDDLVPGDRVWHPYDMCVFTVSRVAPEGSAPGLLFHNRATDENESGLRVTGADDSGETVHVDCAPSYLWTRESAGAELERLRVRIAELEAERHSTNEALSEAHEALRVQRDRIAELEAAAGSVDSDFYQPGHTYTDTNPKYDWQFRCDVVTTHPEDGERTALGWRFFNGTWSECAYGEDDWDVQQFVPTKVARKTVPQQRQTEDPAAPGPCGDPIAYGPTGVRCGCGKDAHSNLTPCRPNSPEDPHDSPLHHDYAESRDLPIPRQVTGRCPNGHTFEDCTCGGTPR